MQRKSDFKQIAEFPANREEESSESGIERKIGEFCDWAAARFDEPSLRSELANVLRPLYVHFEQSSMLRVNCQLERVDVSVTRPKRDIAKPLFGRSFWNLTKFPKNPMYVKTIEQSQPDAEVIFLDPKSKRNSIAKKEMNKKEKQDLFNLTAPNDGLVNRYIDFFRLRKNGRFPYSFPKYED